MLGLAVVQDKSRPQVPIIAVTGGIVLNLIVSSLLLRILSTNGSVHCKRSVERFLISILIKEGKGSIFCASEFKPETSSLLPIDMCVKMSP